MKALTWPIELNKLNRSIALLKGYELKDGEITNDLTGAPVMVKIMEPRYKYNEDEKVARISIL
jgi:hypothetical protein